MKIVTEELIAMQVLEAAATKAPWRVEIDKEDDARLFGEKNEEIATFSYIMSDNTQPDGDFMVAARTFVPRAIEALRFTEASIQEALLMLDDATAAANSTGICEADLLNVIDFAIQKLRPVPAPVHDAAALAKLTDEQLGEVASTVEPGSDAHYDAIMECCNRGLTTKAAHPDGCPKAQGLATCATCWCGEEKPISAFKHAGPPRFELAQQEALDLFLRSPYAAGKDSERIYVRDIMRVSPGTEEPFAANPKVQVQVTVEGYTDWYEVKLNDAGQPDPNLLLKLPF